MKYSFMTKPKILLLSYGRTTFIIIYTKDQKKQINFLKILILSDSEITTKR